MQIGGGQIYISQKLIYLNDLYRTQKTKIYLKKTIDSKSEIKRIEEGNENNIINIKHSQGNRLNKLYKKIVL